MDKISTTMSTRRRVDVKLSGFQCRHLINLAFRAFHDGRRGTLFIEKCESSESKALAKVTVRLSTRSAFGRVFAVFGSGQLGIYSKGHATSRNSLKCSELSTSKLLLVMVFELRKFLLSFFLILTC